MPIRTDRLRILAKHLRTGKLGHKRFDFRVYNSCKVTENYDSKGCGTAGCALGECPIVFPDDWYFDTDENGCQPILAKFQCSIDAAEKFFGINAAQEGHLFHAGFQIDLDKPSTIADVQLGPGATRQQVAANMEAFCDWAEAKSLHVESA